jgi:thiol:disulfide interchange protein DsbC
MTRIGLVKLFCGMCVTWSLACGCAGQTKTAMESPEASLRKSFPNMPLKSIGETDIKGLYEVVSGTNIFYYYPENGYLFFGDIFTTAGKNLTAEKKGELAAALVDNLPLDKAVKTGNGKTVVIEFTDPDCPFCKKAYDFFKVRTDVTIYTFFSPLAHPAAISKIYYILNADDKAKAYNDVFDGKKVTPPPSGYSESIKKLAQEHLDLARSVGVTGTPTFFIEGKQIVGADIPQLEKLLDNGTQKDANKTGKVD